MRHIPLYIAAAALTVASIVALGIGGSVAVALIAWLRW